MYFCFSLWFCGTKNWNGNLALIFLKIIRINIVQSVRKNCNTNSGQLYKKVASCKVKCQTKSFNFLTWWKVHAELIVLCWELSSFFRHPKRMILENDSFYGVLLCVRYILHLLCISSFLAFVSFMLHLLKYLRIETTRIDTSQWRHYNRTWSIRN